MPQLKTLSTSLLSCIAPTVLMPSQPPVCHEQSNNLTVLSQHGGDTSPQITVPRGKGGSARQRCYKGWSCSRQSRKKEELNTDIRIGETSGFWFSRKKRWSSKHLIRSLAIRGEVISADTSRTGTRIKRSPAAPQAGLSGLRTKLPTAPAKQLRRIPVDPGSGPRAGDHGGARPFQRGGETALPRGAGAAAARGG